MERTTASSPFGVVVAALAAVALLGAVPAAASGTTAQSACPSTMSVNGQTAYLSSAICHDAQLGVGIPLGPGMSIGLFDVGYCTGCECGYTYSSEAGSRFTRRAASECGFGSAPGAPSGGGGGGGEGDDLGTDDGCQWGRDYIGWEPAGC